MTLAHHKRRRPKNRRAGCLMCKPHKMNGVKKRGFPGGRPASGFRSLSRTWKQEARSCLDELEQILELYDEHDEFDK